MITLSYANFIKHTLELLPINNYCREDIMNEINQLQIELNNEANNTDKNGQNLQIEVSEMLDTINSHLDPESEFIGNIASKDTPLDDLLELMMDRNLLMEVKARYDFTAIAQNNLNANQKRLQVMKRKEKKRLKKAVKSAELELKQYCRETL